MTEIALWPTSVVGASPPNCFGPITGPDWQHGGINEAEQLYVKKIQTFLNAHGFNAGTVDGIFGSMTAHAVAPWQTSVGYARTGLVYEHDWHKMFDIP